MNDQTGMGQSDSAKDVKKELDPSLHIKLSFVAILVNMFSFDVFKNEIRLATRSDARIDQFRNMRVSELTKNSTFTLESLTAGYSSNCQMQELDRNAALKAPVAALRQPYAPHAALADMRKKSIYANRLPC